MEDLSEMFTSKNLLQGGGDLLICRPARQSRGNSHLLKFVLADLNQVYSIQFKTSDTIHTWRAGKDRFLTVKILKKIIASIRLSTKYYATLPVVGYQTGTLS